MNIKPVWLKTTTELILKCEYFKKKKNSVLKVKIN